jgi:hypothetical protein
VVVQVESSPDATDFIQGHGGQLFVWPTRHRSYRLVLTLLEASDPPTGGLEYRRVDTGQFLLFLHPAIGILPEKLVVEMRGRHRPHVEVYWEGLAYVV